MTGGVLAAAGGARRPLECCCGVVVPVMRGGVRGRRGDNPRRRRDDSSWRLGAGNWRLRPLFVLIGRGRERRRRHSGSCPINARSSRCSRHGRLPNRRRWLRLRCSSLEGQAGHPGRTAERHIYDTAWPPSDQPRWSERSHIASLLRTPDLFGPGAWSLHIRKRELRSWSLCHAPGPNLLGFKSGHIPRTVRVRHLSLISLLISATACSCRFWLRSDTRASSAGGPHWLQPGVGLKSQIGLKRSGPDE